MRVFVSSTYRDLVEHRRAVAEALERLGLQLERMEAFGARPRTALATIRDDVDRWLAIPYFTLDLELLRKAIRSR